MVGGLPRQLLSERRERILLLTRRKWVNRVRVAEFLSMWKNRYEKDSSGFK
jgi:hypothetical protein